MNLFLLLFSFVVLLSYLVYIYIEFGWLKSISESFYYLKPNHKWIFTVTMWGLAVPLMIVGSTGLMFFAGAFICFVGAAAAFKDDKMTETVHVIGAEGGIALAGAAMWIDLHMWYMPMILILFTAWCTTKLNDKWLKLHVPNHTYWIEVLSFVLIFISLFVARV